VPQPTVPTRAPLLLHTCYVTSNGMSYLILSVAYLEYVQKNFVLSIVREKLEHNCLFSHAFSMTEYYGEG